MADSKGPIQEVINEKHNEMASELLTFFIALVLIGILLNGIVTVFNLNGLFSNGFKGLTPKGLALSSTRPLSSVLNPINARVLVSNEKGTDVYDSPGGKKIGSHKLGDYGRVLKGPVVIDGEKYFYVDFEDGVDGWVKEADLNYKEPTVRPLKDSDPLGSNVLASKDTTVLDSPGGKSLGSQPKGAKGFVTQGPIEKNGKKYWFVDFENDPDGWVEEGSLSLYNDGTRHLSSKDGAGTEVVSARDGTGLYDEEGNLIGRVENGIRGEIKKGPKYINGEKYWFVEYENGQSGWVKEGDLRVLTEREKSPGEKVISFISFLARSAKYLIGLICFSLLFLIGRMIRKLTKLRNDKREKLFPNGFYGIEQFDKSSSINPKWQRIISNVSSEEKEKWKLSIIEADIMLDEILSVMMLKGSSIKEKLNNVEESDFITVKLAKEAHDIRNKIVDDPNFDLSQIEAKRVVALYQKVFKEFAYI